MMINKQYFFLAGLHRSGNTVLSAILNQNTEVYCGSLGPLCEYMYTCDKVKSTHQIALANTEEHRSVSVISNMINNYYYDISKPVIIDRDKNWATPSSIELIKKYITNSPKIIFTTRPITEVLASFIAIDGHNIEKYMIDASTKGFYIDPNLSKTDNMCNFLMHERGQIYQTLLSMSTLDDPENSKYVHVIKYEDLLSNTEDVMNKVYKFLDLNKFDHDFYNIEKIESYNEERAGLPKDLHKIRRYISRSEIKVEDYLTQYSIEKYSKWRYC